VLLAFQKRIVHQKHVLADLKTCEIVTVRFAKAFVKALKIVLSNWSKGCELAGFPGFWAT
jgi:hypothetical protein